MKPIRLIAFIVPLFLTFCFGCSSNVTVKGRVQWEDGSPVTEGNVLMENDKVSVIGEIAKDGTFSMGLLKPGEGIPPGKYKAVVMGGDTMLKAPSGKSLIAREYSIAALTPLEVEVVAGKNTPLEFAIKKNPQLTARDNIAPIITND